VARDRGRHRAQCSARLALCVQRVLDAAGNPARAEPSRARARLRRGVCGIRRRHEPRAPRLRPRVASGSRRGLRRRERAGHRAGRRGGRSGAAGHRLRRALRRRWRCGLHPHAAGGEPGGDATPRADERLSRRALSGRRHDRRAPVRVVRPRARRARHARGTRDGPGRRRAHRRVADRTVPRHARGGSRDRRAGRGGAAPSGVLAAVARLLPGGVRRVDGAQSGCRHHHGLWRRDLARRLRHHVHRRHHRRRTPGRRVDGRLAHRSHGRRQRPRRRARRERGADAVARRRRLDPLAGARGARLRVDFRRDGGRGGRLLAARPVWPGACSTRPRATAWRS